MKLRKFSVNLHNFLSTHPWPDFQPLSTLLSFVTHFEVTNGNYFTAGQSLLDEWWFWFIVEGLYCLYYNSSLAIQSYVGSQLVYYVSSVDRKHVYNLTDDYDDFYF